MCVNYPLTLIMIGFDTHTHIDMQSLYIFYETGWWICKNNWMVAQEYLFFSVFMKTTSHYELQVTWNPKWKRANLCRCAWDLCFPRIFMVLINLCRSWSSKLYFHAKSLISGSNKSLPRIQCQEHTDCVPSGVIKHGVLEDTPFLGVLPIESPTSSF